MHMRFPGLHVSEKKKKAIRNRPPSHSSVVGMILLVILCQSTSAPNSSEKRRKEASKQGVIMVVYNFKKMAAVPPAEDLIDIILTRTQVSEDYYTVGFARTLGMHALTLALALGTTLLCCHPIYSGSRATSFGYIWARPPALHRSFLWLL